MDVSSSSGSRIAMRVPVPVRDRAFAAIAPPCASTMPFGDGEAQSRALAPIASPAPGREQTSRRPAGAASAESLARRRSRDSTIVAPVPMRLQARLAPPVPHSGRRCRRCWPGPDRAGIGSAENEGQLRLDIDAGRSASLRAAWQGHGAVERLPDIDPVAAELQRAGLDPGHRQQVADHPVEMLGLVLDLGQQVPARQAPAASARSRSGWSPRREWTRAACGNRG